MTHANDAFYQWERRNNEQDLSDRDRIIWTAGWMESQNPQEGIQTMNEEEAFIKAYSNNVSVAPTEVVEKFVAMMDHQNDEFYKEFREYYTSITDAWGMWRDAIDFAKGKA